MKRAFTLIEVLMAIFVLAFLSVILFQTVSTIFAAEKDLTEAVELHHSARVALDRMTRDLSQAFLSVNQGVDETTKTVFIGERDRIVFCYVGNVPVRAGGLETDQGVIEFRIGGSSDEHGGRKLIRRFKPHIDDDPESGGEEMVLATGVKELRFEYYDRASEDWDSDWKADDMLQNDEPGFVLPPRIRIHLELVDSGGEEHLFDTQTALYMQRPFLFGNPTNEKALEWKIKDQQARLAKQLEAGMVPTNVVPPANSPTPPSPPPPPALPTEEE